MNIASNMWVARARSGLQWLMNPGSGLARRAVHAGFWAFALRITLRLFTTARTVILARLLAPGDFGLMGIALLMMSMLETFTQTGFRAALVQRQGDIRPYLDTAWTVELLRYTLVAAIVYFAAPLAAAFFEAPQARPIIQVISIAIFLHGLRNIGTIYFQKDLEFQKRFLTEAAPAIAQLGVGIGMAVALRSVWALVYGEIASAGTAVIVSYLVHPYRPRPRLDWEKAKEMYRFGRWVFGSSVLVYLLNHLDDLVVGKVLGPVALGLYRMAYNLSQLVSTETTSVMNQVAFPAYAKLQDRQDGLRDAYLRTLQFISLFSFPMAAGLFFLAPTITEVVLGEKWLPMVPAFQLLVIWGLIRSLSASTGPLFQGVGRPELATKIQVMNLLLLGALIFPLTTKWGLAGASWAVVLATMPGGIMGIYLASRVLGISVQTLSSALGYPLLNALFMLTVLFGVQWVVNREPSMAVLVWVIALGVVAYALGIAACRGIFGYTAGGILTRRLRTWLIP